MPAIENINGQAHHAGDQAQGQARPEGVEGLQVRRCRSTTRCTITCCATTWPSTASTPTRTCRSASVPPPEMVANLRADNIDGFLAPDRSTSARSTTASASSTCCPRKSGTGIRAARFAASRGIRRRSRRTPTRRCSSAIIDATAFASKAENRKQIAEAIAPANYLNQPVTVLEQVLTGTYADGLGNVKKDPEPHRLRSVPVAIVRRLDADADEALGPDQGRRRLRDGRRAGVPRHRYRAS